MKKNWTLLTALAFSLLLGLSTLAGACSANNSKKGQDSEQTDGEAALNVMSFNIRYDNKGDGRHQWANRLEEVGTMLNARDLDFIGTQEVLKNQLDDLAALLSDYRYIGVGRDDGKEEGEYAPLFYNTKRWQLKEGGYFWLSQDPEHPGIGWDAACNRIVSWGHFANLANGQEVVCFNLHLDHVGETARRESVTLLKQRLRPFVTAELPVIVMGDFNAAPDSEVIAATKTPLDGMTLMDSYETATHRVGPEWTFHDFGEIPQERRARIDYIFYTAPLHPDTLEIVHPEAESDTTRFLSDHTPVVVTFVSNSGH
ncbi:MAG: endonuclease/exonuclease/phosphatase family protein [Porphyromonas sp.]|nr:endonuclease/exonuclease/phosphatase family protein [Porphyromonas sp.]